MKNRHFRAKSAEEAWNKANEIFPTDYAKDEGSSQRAGYPIFRSTADGHFYDYICDLNDRLEVNLSTGETVNIWIEQIREALAKSPFGESASISISTDGYMEFRPYDSGWRLNRYRCDSTPVAQYEYQEKIALEEER